MSNTFLPQMTQLRCSLVGHVAVLSLNNAPVNALSKMLSDELTAALDIISETPEVRSVVLTGEGKVFCAGADLKGRAEVIKGPGDLPAHSRRTRECFHAIRECTKPVIVAINGPALGAGLAIAASADLIITSEKGSLALPEIDVGLLGGGSHAARLFPHTMLRKMMFTGYRVPADELYRLGVVLQVTTPEGLMPAALELAQTIASKSPLSIGLAKQTLNAIEDMSLRDGYRYEQDMTAAIAKTEDAKEAQRAFLEKRSAVFVGR
jgi:enoyl-CoA hydratase/carnithine racemase